MPLFCTAGPVEGDEFEVQEVPRFDELRQDHLAVVGGVSGVIRLRAVLVLEADEAGVLDAIALGGRDRKEHALGQARVGRELHFVIGLRQRQDFSGGRAGFLVAGAELLRRATEAGAQFVQREGASQPQEHLPAEVSHQPKFLKLSLEYAVLVGGAGHLLGLEAVARGGIDGDVAAGIKQSGAKSDRGDVTFARGPEAQDETQRAGRQVRLVRMRHDRGIEQRGGFERILVTEIGAEQKLPFFGQVLVGVQAGADLLESGFEKIPGLGVALAEFRLHLLPEGVDFSFREGHDLGANSGGAGVARKEKRPEQHARAVWMQDDLAALDGGGLHGWEGLRSGPVEGGDRVLHELQLGQREQESER